MQSSKFGNFLEKSIEIGSFINFNNITAIKMEYQSIIHNQALEKSNNLILVKYEKRNKDNFNQNTDYRELIQVKTNALKKKREMHTLLLFIFLLFVIIITLSQILGKLINND